MSSTRSTSEDPRENRTDPSGRTLGDREDVPFDERADEVERRLDEIRDTDGQHRSGTAEPRREGIRDDDRDGEEHATPRDETVLQTADGQDDEAGETHTRVDDTDDAEGADGDDDGIDPEEEAESRRRAEEFAREHDPADHDIAAGEEFRQRGDIIAEDGRSKVVDRDGNLQDAGDEQSLADGTASPDRAQRDE